MPILSSRSVPPARGGGKDTRSADKETTLRYLDGINTVTSSAEYDLLMLQEVDTSSTRSYSINHAEHLSQYT